MSSSEETPAGDARAKESSLSEALDQSEQVHEKVEQAAADLSSVNAVLKDDIAVGRTARDRGAGAGPE